MKLQHIEIKNFKSIKSTKISINKCNDESYTFGIIGENEAGKSSILKAIALSDNLNSVTIKANDFNDKNQPITVLFNYIVSTIVSEKIVFAVKQMDSEVNLPLFEEMYLQIQIHTTDIETVKKSILISKDGKAFSITLNKDSEITNYIEHLIHKTVFWNFDTKYLISKEINLQSFFNSPEDISIPLKNCFKLSGYSKDDFPEIQSILNDSTERENLRENLSRAVTTHLRSVWKKHKVRITFDITETTLNFHVKDEGSKTKAKTIEQRSDGFKQFISFLLTVSAENINSDLKNTILLLDEPETHLHPKAQEDLLEELIEMTKKNNNILFYATHSNYLIDKNFIERNIKVVKENDETYLESFEPKTSSYASINYEVFGIASTDYHNEMYDYLRDKFSEEKNIPDLGINKFDEQYFKQDKKLKKDRPNKGESNQVTLPTYIRNCIHYPINKTRKFDDLLVESIDLLKKYSKEI